MKHFFSFLIPFLMLSACCSSPKERTLSFDGIENAQDQESLKQKYLK